MEVNCFAMAYTTWNCPYCSHSQETFLRKNIKDIVVDCEKCYKNIYLKIDWCYFD